MSLATVNQRRAMSLSVMMPLRGAWQAKASLDGTEPVTSATISAPGLSLTGTMRRTGPFLGRTGLSATGGRGGLGVVREAKAYRGISVRLIVEDILRESGEILATDADSTILGLTFLHWTRQRDRAGHQLTRLVEAVGATWRLRDAGTVWIGVDTYPTITFDHVFLHEDPARSRLSIAPVDARLRPGVTFLNRRVVNVTHHFTDKLRTEVEYQ